jgi:hypothetical protein
MLSLPKYGTALGGQKRTPAAREEQGLGDRSEKPVRAAKLAPEIDKAGGSCGSIYGYQM